MTKWEEWQGIHAEEDVKDLNIIIAILTLIAVLIAVLSLAVG